MIDMTMASKRIDARVEQFKDLCKKTRHLGLDALPGELSLIRLHLHAGFDETIFDVEDFP